MKHLFNPNDLPWIPFKLLLIAWAIMYGVFTPASTETILAESIRWVWLTATGVGAGVSLIGMMLQTSTVGRRKTVGYLLEVSGLALAAIGPAVYFTTQLMLSFTTAGSHVSILAMPLIVLSAIIARLVQARGKEMREDIQLKWDER